MPEIRTLALVVITSLVLVILGVGSISSQAQASTKKYIGDEFGINSIRLAPTQHVSANSSAVIDFKTLLNVPIELYQPISIAVNSVALENLPDNNLTVSSVNYSQNWLYAILVTNHAVDNHWEEVRDKDLVEVLANRREDGGWISFVKGTQGFLQLAQAAPSSWMDFSYLTKDASSRPSTVNLTQSVEYLFPWIAGQNWFQVQGWHQGDHLDFQPVVRTNPPTHFAVLAAAEGTMSLVCGGRGTLDPYQVHIRISHPDGNSTYYLHLDANTIRYDLIGKSITRGQFIGLLYNGVQGSGNGYQFNTNCGYGQAVHLHFGVPRNITINGYAVNTVASATFATKYGSSNMRIDDVDVPGWFTTDVHLSTGSGFTIARWAQQQGGYWDSQKWFTGDFDGDGKTDFANLYNDNGFASIDVHRSTGTSFELQHWAGQQGGYWDSQKWFTGDFNGDGKTDFANLYNDNGFASIDVHRSTGTSFELQHWAGQQGGYWDSQKWFTGDFNGDKKVELTKIWKDIGPVVNSVASTGAVLATPYSLAEIPSDTFTSAVTLTQAIHFEIPSTLAAYSRNLTTLPNNLIGLNRFYESSAVYSNSLQLAIPTQPYSLTIQYDEPDIMGVNEYTIALYYWNGNQWVKEPSSTLDTVNNRVNATPKVLGQWAILGSNSWPIYLPTIVK